MSSISVVISAFNEEKKIKLCLQSVAWADEIIVVDNESTDATRDIAIKFGAKIFTRLNYAMLNVNKNFGFNQATSEWILNLDGDEQVPEELAAEIRKIIVQNAPEQGFKIPRKNIIFGKWIKNGLWWPDYQVRLFRKGKGRFQEKHVHEYIEIEGLIGTLEHPLIHSNYETISQFLRKLDTIYTNNEVDCNLEKKTAVIWSDAIRFPVSDFVKIFFLQRGYRDGLHGLVLALLQAFYSFIIFAKMWEKKGFIEYSITIPQIEKEFIRSQKELHYWLISAKINESKNYMYKLMQRIQRKYVKNS